MSSIRVNTILIVTFGPTAKHENVGYISRSLRLILFKSAKTGMRQNHTTGQQESRRAFSIVQTYSVGRPGFRQPCIHNRGFPLTHSLAKGVGVVEGLRVMCNASGMGKHHFCYHHCYYGYRSSNLNKASSIYVSFPVCDCVCDGGFYCDSKNPNDKMDTEPNIIAVIFRVAVRIIHSEQYHRNAVNP